MRAFEFLTEGSGPHFRPTPEQQQEIADLYASGFSGDDIAKEYKASKGTISRFIRNLPNFKELRQQFYKAREEQGLQTGPKGITPDQVQQMANNFALGKNFNQLNKEFGISPENVLGKLKKLPNFEELLQQNTKARQEQGLLTLDDLGRKDTTPAQIDQMAKEYASGKSTRQIAKMFNLAQSVAIMHLAKRPDWEELKFQSLTNRSKKLGGTQSLTSRGINKPGSKGIHAIRRTGSPSGSVFEDEIMRSFEFMTEVSAADLDQWNPERFQTQQEGDPIGMVSDKQAFSSNLPSCLDMPIKLPGTSIKNPYKNKGVIEFVQRSLQHNQKVNPRFDQSYVYLTVDQRMVEGNKTHRRGGAHFDGMQGERYKIKLPMDQNYIVSDYNPTHLYSQPFDARGLSTKHHNWFHELEKQVDKSRTFVPDPYVIYFVSGYHMHESPVAPETRMRTFMRISVGYKPGGLPGETPNPLLPTPRLDRDREIPGNLKKDLKVGTAPDPNKIIGVKSRKR